MLLAMTFVYIKFRKQFLQSQISLWNIVQSFRHCHFEKDFQFKYCTETNLNNLKKEKKQHRKMNMIYKEQLH